MSRIKNAIILLAGIGQRLKPLTDNSHKALLTIGDKTILERQLTTLKEAGIEKFHLALGHRANDIQKYLSENFPAFTIQFYNNENFANTNTAYSLWQVIQTMKDGFLLLDGDVLFAKELIHNLLAHENKNVLLCENDPNKLDPEAVKFKINSENQIIEIGKHVSLQEAQGESIGIGQFQADWNETLNTFFADELSKSENWQWYYEDAFQKLLKNQKAPSPFFTLPTEPYPWVEVDDLNDFKNAQKLFGNA